jgi:streptogramin lyase
MNALKSECRCQDGDIFEYALSTAASQPIGITHGPDGAVWFAEFAANRFGRLDVKTVGKPTPPGVQAVDVTASIPPGWANEAPAAWYPRLKEAT